MIGALAVSVGTIKPTQKHVGKDVVAESPEQADDEHVEAKSLPVYAAGGGIPATSFVWREASMGDWVGGI